MTAEPLSRLLERLVDEELDDVEMRELLARLDSDRDGWRACALAFLEAQTLRRELRRMIGAGPPSRPAPEIRLGTTVPVVPRADSARRVNRWTVKAVRGMALAASIALAFAAGTWWPQRHGTSGTDSIASQRTRPAEHAGEGERTVPVPRSSRAPAEHLAEARGDALEPPLAHVQLRVPTGDAAPQLVEVPVYRWNATSALPEVAGPPVLPPEVRTALERLGGGVQEEQFWAPVALENGQHAVVPIKQLRITPAASRYGAY